MRMNNQTRPDLDKPPPLERKRRRLYREQPPAAARDSREAAQEYSPGKPWVRREKGWKPRRGDRNDLRPLVHPRSIIEPATSPPATQSPTPAPHRDTRESAPSSSPRSQPPISLSANSAKSSEQSSQRPALSFDVPSRTHCW